MDACSALESRTPSAIQNLKNHNRAVHSEISDMTRYTEYNRRLLKSNRFKLPEQIKILQDQLAAIKTANEEYKKTSNTFMEKIDKLAAELDPTEAMKTCRDTIFDENNRTSKLAIDLMAIPNQICNQFNETFNKFNGELNKAYTLIGEPIPK